MEAEDAQRVLLAALNGLAGLMLLEGDVQLAVATYRQVRRAQPGYCMHPYGELLQVLFLAGVQRICGLFTYSPAEHVGTDDAHRRPTYCS